jgi:hypothetical protein
MIDQMQMALLMILGLQFKHIICDGPLQTLQMVRDKSVYGKPRGLLHALVHVAGSFIVLLIAGLPITSILGLAILDGVIHYHVDFTKENLVKYMGWTNVDSPFWWALTTDQALHHMTYVMIVWLALTP